MGPPHSHVTVTSRFISAWECITSPFSKSLANLADLHLRVCLNSRLLETFGNYFSASSYPLITIATPFRLSDIKRELRSSVWRQTKHGIGWRQGFWL